MELQKIRHLIPLGLKPLAISRGLASDPARLSNSRDEVDAKNPWFFSVIYMRRSELDREV